ncbi:hypothetical protein [Roseibium sediminicola]|uniref:Uncharacterized protein n=1 Tax=Roseibium sediminicola TaxID=2933272 RepID=A0ABT0H2D3_9HYPH|nr:hypothetical protein [Roseibium sp. CAU 1639]MCK7615238.1 hypothetical protein [Roseibium sp. CAU 1639]
MDILSSILAFAGLMIVFSTLVSGIVESLIGFFRLRSSNLELMLRSFVKEELKAANPDKIVEALVKNPVVGSKLSFFSNSSRIDWLSTKAFFQRLAKTEVGEKIIDELEKKAGEKGSELYQEYLKKRIEYLENTYDRYAAASSETLRKNAYVLTFGAAIVFAFLFNINVETIFTKLLNSPDVRQEIIASIEGNENLYKDLENLEKRLSDEIEKLSDPNFGNDDAKKLIPDLTEQLKQTKISIDALSGAGLPIGWDYYPFGDNGKIENPETWAAALQPVRWFVFTLVAGFLISLGGPFWYRVFNNLSGLVSALRAFSGKNPELVEEKGSQAKPEPQTSADRTDELAKAFMLVFEESKNIEQETSAAGKKS